MGHFLSVYFFFAANIFFCFPPPGAALPFPHRMVRGLLVSMNGRWTEFCYEKHDLAAVVAQKLCGDSKLLDYIGCRLIDRYTELGYWLRIFYLRTATAEDLPINKPMTKLWGAGPVRGPIIILNEEYIHPIDLEKDELELLLKVAGIIDVKTPEEQFFAMREEGLTNDVAMARNRRTTLQQFFIDTHAAGQRCSNQLCEATKPDFVEEGKPQTGGRKKKGKGAVSVANTDQVVQFMVCSQCYRKEYCSAECQRAHWVAGHKRKCPKTPIDQLPEDVMSCARAGLRQW
eukprot:NODE_963_length_1204_cov_255.477056_g729_i0.p1 GENE.NODE_963_length_1204_cov_255.477056_g729_i0~~NODE_963_length_1204_cov_255.477056_g729_i0.p1  ORF type:complete len:287 (+),score=83.77 NODE_963_length_1204_cov_255.477056_g729_i0:283-1143(+)